MRYYNIQISPSSSNPNAFAPVTFTSQNSSGSDNGAALMLDLDVFQGWYHQPTQNGYIKLHGVSFQTLNQSANFNPVGTNYANIQISVGMSKGLPYANPDQQGLIINGSILQAFGNWQGNEVSLDLIVIPSNYNPNPNITFNWIAGNTLEQAVRNTLTTAYPNVPINGSFDKKLVYTETQPGQFFNLTSFAKYVNNVSKTINNSDTYQGASIAPTSSGFVLFDGSTPPTVTKNINFTDIVGNLTWINTFTIQAKLIMRADLDVGQYITFPIGTPVINTSNSFAQFRNNISFQGKFIINQIRHVGNSRQPDGNSWVTIVDCVIPGQTP